MILALTLALTLTLILIQGSSESGPMSNSTSGHPPDQKYKVGVPPWFLQLWDEGSIHSTVAGQQGQHLQLWQL